MDPPRVGDKFGNQPESVERALADHLQCGEVVTTASGLSALECALVASGAGPGSVVACDALYPFAAMAILNVGARPVAIDLDADTLAPGVEQLRVARDLGAAIVVVTSYVGRRAVSAEFADRAFDLRLGLVEDRAQCFGRHTDPWLAAYSFQQGKLLSCGFGGAVAVPMGRSVDPVRRAAGLGWWPRAADPEGEWSSGWRDRVPGRSSRLPPIAADLLQRRLAEVETQAAVLRRSLEGLFWLVDSVVGGDGQVPPAEGARLVSVRLRSRCALAELLSALRDRGVVAGRPTHPPVTRWPAFVESWASVSSDLAGTQEVLRSTLLVSLDTWAADEGRRGEHGMDAIR